MPLTINSWKKGGYSLSDQDFQQDGRKLSLDGSKFALVPTVKFTQFDIFWARNEPHTPPLDFDKNVPNTFRSPESLAKLFLGDAGPFGIE